MTDKKPGFFKRLFARKPRDGDAAKEKKASRPSSAPPASTDGVSGSKAKEKRGADDGGGHGHGHKKAAIPSVKVDPPQDDKKSPAAKKPPVPSAAAKQKKPSQEAVSRSTDEGTKQRRLSRKKRKDGLKGSGTVVIAPADPNQRLEFPTTPEMILAIHKRKPFLDKNEEWLVVELNEYECLVENLDIIKTIATHSKFFEVEPDELWEEFFEYVEEMPSYDEVINYDVWQEFRDEKYPC